MTIHSENSSNTYHVATRTLIKVSSVALLVAAMISVLFVLPAERGIDVTGVGSALGLTQMANSEDAEDDTPVASATSEPGGYLVPAQTKASIVKVTPMRSDETSITLAAHTGAEIKAHMKTGDHLIYRWTSTAPVKADMHGEKKGDTSGAFTQYWKEKNLSKDQGALTAPFEGSHGWYFRNQGEIPLTVTVETSGFYEDVFQPQAE